MSFTPSFVKRTDRMFKIIGDTIPEESRPTVQGVILDTIILLENDYQEYLKKTPFDDRISFAVWLLGDWRR